MKAALPAKTSLARQWVPFIVLALTLLLTLVAAYYPAASVAQDDKLHLQRSLFFLGGTLFSLLLFFVTYAQVRARTEAERAVAESLRSEEALRASETRHRTLIEQSPVSIQIFEPSGRTVQVNRAWEELWGVTLADIGDYNILEDPQLVEKGITPYIQRGFAGEAAAIPAIMYDPNVTIPNITTHEDPVRWVQAVIYPVKDEEGRVREVVLMHEDITERKRAERDLQESEGRFRTLIEATFDGIVIHSEGAVIDANRGFAEMFGYTLDELIGKPISALVVLEDRELVRQKIMTGNEQPYEVTGLRKDGTTFSLEVTGKAHTYKGRRVRVSALRDITVRRRLEEQLRARADELAEANRLKDEFLATLSHELRTPLTAVLGWAKLLRTENFNEETRTRALETIERNAQAQTQLIGDLLDVSRIITGKLRLRVRPLDLAPVIEAAFESLRPAAEARGVSLRVRLDPGAGHISGDPDRLQQVVWNLLSNAIKFTPRGGTVEVRLEGTTRAVEISVRDTGRGIRTEFLPYVFDRFRQADGAITREHGGLGLGLAIVRHLVELHGGTVQAASAGEGQGATFTVRLPLMPAPEDGGTEQRDGEEAGSATGAPSPARVNASVYPSLEGLHILLVDDDEDARIMISVVLEGCGASVTAFSSASEALEAIERVRPDVLVSDIGMPHEDGYELIRKLRALDPARGGRTPAAALTAYARSEDRAQALAAGYQAHISKPIDPDELAKSIAAVAGRL